MKTLSFSFPKKYLYVFLFFGISSCVIPIPEQNFWSNPTSEEYDIFDEATKNINTYQLNIATQNRDFLNTLEQKASSNSAKKEWFEKATSANQLGQSLTEEIEDVWKNILTSTGGTDNNGYPLGADQKMAADKLLFEDGKADFLQNKLNKTKATWLALIPEEDAKKISNAFPNIFSEKNWFSEKTKNQRVGILQLAFAELLFEIEQTEGILLEYFWKKMGSPKIVEKQFEIMSVPRTPYIIRGEVFESEIFLAPVFQPENADEMTLSVNGMRMRPDNGKVNFKERASKIGDRTYKVAIKHKDPETGEMVTQNKDFKYTVGDHSMTVSANKMNVFYIGVDNPISITAAGISSNNLKVSVSGAGANIKRRSKNGWYTLNASKTGECFIHVEADGMKVKAHFRVKRIPNPVARVANNISGAIGVGEFKAQKGVLAVLENFDFDARCKIQGFILYRFSSSNGEEMVRNVGARFTSESLDLIQKTKPGDIYTFENVKARCPGDPAGRKINSMVFRIK